MLRFLNAAFFDKRERNGALNGRLTGHLYCVLPDHPGGHRGHHYPETELQALPQTVPRPKGDQF